VLAVLVVGGGWWFGRAPQPEALQAPTQVTTGTADSITVHVAGAVVAPGLVRLPGQSRVADAVAAAGGATGDANLSALNLAGVLVDEQQVVVPGLQPDSRSSPADTDGRVRINSATVGEVETLPGVGPVLAERIVAHRDAFGPFAEVESLLDVSGIGEAKLAALRDSVVVP
jgi:competence protein ComEA